VADLKDLLGTWAPLSWKKETIATGDTVDVLDDEKVIHHVDVSWNQAFTKTDLIRIYKLANGMLTITAGPEIDPFSGKEVIHRLEFRKV
jgi:hypothetical protein